LITQQDVIFCIFNLHAEVANSKNVPG
jgi:hypothetical protein